MYSYALGRILIMNVENILANTIRSCFIFQGTLKLYFLTRLPSCYILSFGTHCEFHCFCVLNCCLNGASCFDSPVLSPLALISLFHHSRDTRISWVCSDPILLTSLHSSSVFSSDAHRYCTFCCKNISTVQPSGKSFYGLALSHWDTEFKF